MGLVFSKKTDPKDYEKLLGDLDEQVRSLDVDIIKRRSTERRTSILILGYAALIYLLMILYIFFYPWRYLTDDGAYQQVTDGAVLVLYPVLVWMIRRIALWVLRSRIVSLEQRLKTVRGLQKQKLEELKKQTAYYQTKGLLERFDPEFAKATPAKKEPAKEQTKAKALTALLQNHVPHQDPPAFITATMSPATPPSIIQHVAVPTWFDRVMDSLIGDDRMSKYALICPRCHSHNGLVRPEDYETVHYTCPNCKTYIPARKPASPSASPAASLEAVASEEPAASDASIAPAEAIDDKAESSILPDVSADSFSEIPEPTVSSDASTTSLRTSSTRRRRK